MKMTRQRSSVPYAGDCAVEFVGYADNRNAEVDVWRIIVGGSTFTLEMMRLRRSNANWVFGSIKNESGELIWTFRSDPRVKSGFFGDVYTKAFRGNPTTWVFFESGEDRSVKHVLPFVELLMPKPDSRVIPLVGQRQTNEQAGNDMQWFIENVLTRMGQS